MKKLIISPVCRNSVAVALIFVQSGCGLFREVNQSREGSLFKSTTEYSKDSTKLVLDRSVVIVKEKTDTAVLVPEEIVRQDGYFCMDSLVNGITAIKSDLVDVRLVFNPVKQRLYAEAILKPRKISVWIDKETAIHKHIEEQSIQVENSRIQLKDEKTKVCVEKKPLNIQYWFVVFLVTLVVVILVFRLVILKFFNRPFFSSFAIRESFK